MEWEGFMHLRDKSLRAFAFTCTVLTGLAVPALAEDVTHERLLNSEKDKGNWLLHHGTYASHRYSPLSQINRETVKNLRVAWTLHLGGVEGGGIWSHGGRGSKPGHT